MPDVNITGYKRVSCDLATGETATTSTFVTPVFPTPSYTIFNQKLKTLRGNGREWNFASGIQWRLKAYSILSNTIVAEVDSSAFPVVTTVANTATSLILQWSPGNGVDTSIVTVAGALNLTTGEMDWLLSMTMDATLYANYGVWSGAIIFDILPQSVATKHLMCYQSPFFGGVIRNDATRVDPGFEAGSPGYGYPPPLSTPATNFGPAAVQLVSVWDIGTRTALAIAGTDTVGRLIRFKTYGLGHAVRVEVEWFPTNNLYNLSWVAHCPVKMVPMAGDNWDCQVWYRDYLETTSHPVMARRKIKEMTNATGDVSNTILNADVYILMNPGAPSVDGKPTAGQVTHAVEELTRIRNYFGTDLSYIVHTGQPATNGLGLFPDIETIQPNYETFFSSLLAIGGFSIIPYTVPAVVDPLSNYIAADGTRLNHVLLEPDQSRLEVPPGFLDDIHYVWNFNRVNRVDLAAQFGQAPTYYLGISGLYLDVYTSTSAGDYNQTIPTAERGAGANHDLLGRVDFLDKLRTFTRVTEGSVGFAIMGEFYDMYTLPYIDGASSQYHNYPIALDPYCQVTDVIFNQYIRPVVYLQATWAPHVILLADYDVWMWTYERQFHSGAPITFQLYNFDTLPYVIPQESDNFNYNTISSALGGGGGFARGWTAIYSTQLIRLRNWARTAKATGLRYYFRGEKLRPLPGSFEDRVAQYNFEYTVGEVVPGSGVTGALVSGQKPQFTAYYGPELGSVGIIVTNRGFEDQDFQLIMTPERYPRMVGKPYLVRNVNGVRTLLQVVGGSLNIVLSVDAGTCAVYELLPTPPLEFNPVLPPEEPPPPPAPPVPPPPPITTLVCSAVVTNVEVGDTVVLGASGGIGTPDTYVWNAPEGTPKSGTGVNFSTVYSAVGVYTVQVTSGTQTASCVITVSAVAPPPPPPPPPTTMVFSVKTNLDVVHSVTGLGTTVIDSRRSLVVSQPFVGLDIYDLSAINTGRSADDLENPPAIPFNKFLLKEASVTLPTGYTVVDAADKLVTQVGSVASLLRADNITGLHPRVPESNTFHYIEGGERARWRVVGAGVDPTPPRTTVYDGAIRGWFGMDLAARSKHRRVMRVKSLFTKNAFSEIFDNGNNRNMGWWAKWYTTRFNDPPTKQLFGWIHQGGMASGDGQTNYHYDLIAWVVERALDPTISQTESDEAYAYAYRCALHQAAVGLRRSVDDLTAQQGALLYEKGITPGDYQWPLTSHEWPAGLIMVAIMSQDPDLLAAVTAHRDHLLALVLNTIWGRAWGSRKMGWYLEALRAHHYFLTATGQTALAATVFTKAQSAVVQFLSEVLGGETHFVNTGAGTRWDPWQDVVTLEAMKRWQDLGATADWAKVDALSATVITDGTKLRATAIGEILDGGYVVDGAYFETLSLPHHSSLFLPLLTRMAAVSSIWEQRRVACLRATVDTIGHTWSNLAYQISDETLQWAPFNLNTEGVYQPKSWGTWAWGARDNLLNY